MGGTINKCSLRSLECKTVAEGIPQLTAITFARHGKLYATQNVLVPGAAEVIRVETHRHRR